MLRNLPMLTDAQLGSAFVDVLSESSGKLSESFPTMSRWDDSGVRFVVVWYPLNELEGFCFCLLTENFYLLRRCESVSIDRTREETWETNIFTSLCMTWHDAFRCLLSNHTFNTRSRDYFHTSDVLSPFFQATGRWFIIVTRYRDAMTKRLWVWKDASRLAGYGLFGAYLDH